MLPNRLISQTKKSFIPRILIQSFKYSTYKPTVGAHEGYVPPDLNGIELRWSKMSEFDQTDLIDHLQERQSSPWSQLSIPEKRALYFIYYGAWGPRAKIPAQSLAATVLKRLSVFLAVIGLAVAGFNWAVDIEEEQRVNDVIDKITALKIEELKIKELGQEKLSKENQVSSTDGKRWWFF